MVPKTPRTARRRVRKSAPYIGGIGSISYKNPGVLRKFVTEQGTIVARIETGMTQKEQRRLAREVKRARHLALLPFTQTL
jgi:small subunit ribosomal protein S18